VSEIPFRRKEYDFWELFCLYNTPTSWEPSNVYVIERASDVLREITMLLGGGEGTEYAENAEKNKAKIASEHSQNELSSTCLATTVLIIL
jgi:hypothetical protein